ncbi:uncharacterized protein M421DRAFT_406513 [Didymella exigua CBS 183.55]|uniref:Acyclic terpene utilisation N-terminal domain-containing protein n=1 Tax=Didymella exigua CBS 183.55 TaxID=1150837 RepID=A0A6A5R8W5_9PLEO|nr:uncharacterized protein M421DRAFT_406513 [Didymella exigua CBS 183.55]KAF1923424.1 hypothetical protein M421DRAFT_406513 [Didymella exigua CBS 183.55]
MALASNHEHDPMDVLVGDWMGEANMTAPANRQTDAYEPTFLEALEPAPHIARRGIRVAVNADAADTQKRHGAVTKRHGAVAKLVAAAGLQLSGAWISGDEVLPQLLAAQESGDAALESVCTGRRLDHWPFAPVFAQAFEQGADMVLCAPTWSCGHRHCLVWARVRREPAHRRGLLARPTAGTAGSAPTWTSSQTPLWPATCPSARRTARAATTRAARTSSVWAGTRSAIPSSGLPSPVRSSPGTRALAAKCRSTRSHRSSCTRCRGRGTSTRTSPRCSTTSRSSTSPTTAPPATKVGIAAKAIYQAERRGGLTGLDIPAKARMTEHLICAQMGAHAANLTHLSFQTIGHCAESPTTQNAATVDFRVIARARSPSTLCPALHRPHHAGPPSGRVRGEEDRALRVPRFERRAFVVQTHLGRGVSCTTSLDFLGKNCAGFLDKNCAGFLDKNCAGFLDKSCADFSRARVVHVPLRFLARGRI